MAKYEYNLLTNSTHSFQRVTWDIKSYSRVSKITVPWFKPIFLIRWKLLKFQRLKSHQYLPISALRSTISKNLMFLAFKNVWQYCIKLPPISLNWIFQMDALRIRLQPLLCLVDSSVRAEVQCEQIGHFLGHFFKNAIKHWFLSFVV